MKKITHPFLNQSLVQMKDGSVYFKHWLFFRPSLHLEVDAFSNILWKNKSIEKNSVTKDFKKSKKNVNNSTIS